jgi:hypothetical protein
MTKNIKILEIGMVLELAADKPKININISHIKFYQTLKQYIFKSR